MREVQDSQSRAELAVQNCCWEADSITVRSAIVVSRLQVEIEDLQEKTQEAAQQYVRRSPQRLAARPPHRSLGSHGPSSKSNF
jgi:hypothetical protein